MNLPIVLSLLSLPLLGSRAGADPITFTAFDQNPGPAR